MMLIPQMDCCTLLGIDPKTLRQWLKQATMPLAAHPTDARLKCLTQEHVQQLATLHGRPLPWPAAACPVLPDALPPLLPMEGQAHPPQASEAKPLPTAGSGSLGVAEAAALLQKLASLERSVTTMQEQLTRLVLEGLRERQRSADQRLSVLEALVQQMLGPAPVPPALQQTTGVGPADASPSPGRHLLPAELRARSRVTPLIEYGAQGCYVLVCPQEGTLPFAPESAEWFDWLASLTSFRFVGQQGRFTAYRDSERGQRTRCWRAHRHIHGRNYRHYLGTTDRLTLASLEQAAAKLQAYVNVR